MKQEITPSEQKGTAKEEWGKRKREGPGHSFSVKSSGLNHAIFKKKKFLPDSKKLQLTRPHLNIIKIKKRKY